MENDWLYEFQIYIKKFGIILLIITIMILLLILF